MHHCCPHHADALARYRVDAVDTWRCERCEGLWLPGAMVAQLVSASPQWPAHDETRTTTLCCPDDGAGLRAVDHRGIELDLCPRCHGLWLDRGELVQILALRGDVENAGGIADALTEEAIGELVDNRMNAMLEQPAAELQHLLDTSLEPARGIVRGLQRLGGGNPGTSARPFTYELERTDSAAVLDVERETSIASLLPGENLSLDAGAADSDVDASLLADAAQLAVEGLGAVFEFIGEVFSEV